MKKFLGFIFSLLLSGSLFAQSGMPSSRAGTIAYSRSIVDTLTSPFFWGRGYTKNGMTKTADYLSDYFKSLGLVSFHKNYKQAYCYDVNTFPDNMALTIDGKKLLPGVDFIVSPESSGNEVSGTLTKADSVTFIDQKNKIIIEYINKLTWSVAQEAEPYTRIQVRKDLFNTTPVSYKVDIENKRIKNFEAYNVSGYVRGTIYPDSFLFVTAHYDHLGGMGADTYFPGANDNASGIALLLNLADYYKANPQPYSIGFICFSGEEIGLLGSKYYSEHPPIPLKNIKFLLNTDLAGTGEEGITVVNATEYSEAFSLLNKVNKAGNYVVAINARGKAANSDHFYFSEKNVPAFFVYTLGGIKAYHDVHDKAATLPLNEQEDLYRLIIDFYTSISSKHNLNK